MTIVKKTTSMTSILNAHPSVRLQSTDTGVVESTPALYDDTLENPVTDAGKEVCETLVIAEGDCQTALKDTKDMCSSAPDTPAECHMVMMMMYPQIGKLKNMYEVDDDGAKAIMNSCMKCALEQSVESESCNLVPENTKEDSCGDVLTSLFDSAESQTDDA